MRGVVEHVAQHRLAENGMPRGHAGAAVHGGQPGGLFVRRMGERAGDAIGVRLGDDSGR